MQIAVKLMGLLKPRTPAGGRIELAEGATITDALRVLEIDAPPTFMFSVNGQLERSRERTLSADDQLTILPPVGGG